jgi:L-fuconolactonase
MSIPIIDTHIHLFDPTRPQGVPWPPKDWPICKPSLPAQYRTVTQGLGVAGAIEVECSPWEADNQWVLDVAADDTIIVGKIGNLEPGAPDFRKKLEKLGQNPLFRGIRYGNLWDTNLSRQLSRPEFVADLKFLAQSGMGLDSANPDIELLAALLKVTDLVPDLRVIVDHLPQFVPTPDQEAKLAEQLRELAARPQVYFKVSEVLRRVDGKVPTDLNFYRAKLDQMWDAFGEDRLMYGSDWPNSEQWLPYNSVFSLVREYFAAKGPAAEEKFFWKNSIAAYHWIKRADNQPSA